MLTLSTMQHVAVILQYLRPTKSTLLSNDSMAEQGRVLKFIQHEIFYR